MKLTIKTIFLGLLFTINAHANDLMAVQAEIKSLFDNMLLEDDIYNASVAIFSPSKNIDWSFIGGEFRTNEKVLHTNPFHTASIGKTFTATAVLMLYEQGHLKLNDRITKHLPKEVVSGLHKFEGKNYANEITIKHLLQHTSGLPNYFEDETTDGLLNGMSLLFEETERIWSPEELVNISKVSMKPHFIPGADYRYSDTGYILLGLIVERASGLDLHDFFERHIFAPLDMKNTHMHLRAQPDAATERITELYAGNIEISTFKSLSLDWAGGGIASTADDLNKFQIALHNHQLLSLETLKKMQQWVPESKGVYYGLGLRKVSVEERLSSKTDFTLLGHTGSTSSFMFFCPELDVYLSGSFNQIDQVALSIKVPIKVLTHIQKGGEK
jgi:D-alanyl-D-alanine carboxypeptidase